MHVTFCAFKATHSTIHNDLLEQGRAAYLLAATGALQTFLQANLTGYTAWHKHRRNTERLTSSQWSASRLQATKGLAR